MPDCNFLQGFSSLPMICNGRSRCINAENPHGEKGRGCTAASNLGPSRKGSPCITLKQGQTATLAEMEGPGVIGHIWMTVTDRTKAGSFVLRDLVLRMYWDDEEQPSVESPLGDFFCNGFAASYPVNSLPIAVNPSRGFNCYFPMPFRKKAKITVENQHPAEIPGFFYQVDYCLYDTLPEESGYFHAQWKRQSITAPGQDYVILDGVRGRGQYIGTFLELAALQRYWWGEGEVKFYIDEDEEYPTLCSTGTEDYFGGAWSFASQKDGQTVENQYCTPFLGYPFYSASGIDHFPFYMNDCVPLRCFYRWHIMDPIHFESGLKAAIQQIGVCEQGLFERQDDVSTVAYWYQAEPHSPFQPFAPREARRPR